METTNNLPSFFALLRVTKHSPLISTAELERLYTTRLWKEAQRAIARRRMWTKI